MNFRLLLGSFVFCLFISEHAFALIPESATETDIPVLDLTPGEDQPYLLVEADELKKDDRTPASGSLLFPDESNRKIEKETKKCMTVCLRWGEDCIIDPARGRQCRRTCKEFGEECF